MRELWEKRQTDFTKLDSSEVRMRRDAFHGLTMEYGGRTWDNVRPVRPFPLSAPHASVFFLDADGNQIGYIADSGELGGDARTLLDEELSLLYFSTRVEYIESVKSRHGVTTWRFGTQRGEKTVYVKDRNDIRTLPGKRVIFTDTNGMRFEVEDSAKLDEKSQALLEAET